MAQRDHKTLSYAPSPSADPRAPAVAIAVYLLRLPLLPRQWTRRHNRSAHARHLDCTIIPCAQHEDSNVGWPTHQRPYEDRRHAGAELAARLRHLKGRPDVGVLACLAGCPRRVRRSRSSPRRTARYLPCSETGSPRSSRVGHGGNRIRWRSRSEPMADVAVPVSGTLILLGGLSLSDG